MDEKGDLRISPAAVDGWRSRQLLAGWAFVILLVAAGFLVRLWPMSRAHFWDEAVYLQNAEVICCGKTNYSELDSRPPLLSLIFAAVFLLWHSVYAASVVTALMNALGPAFLYFSGRILTGRTAAAIASLLLAFSPFFVGVIPEWFASDNTGNSLLSDCPALTLVLLAFWLLLRALRKQTDLRFASAGFVLGLVVLMRFASLSSVGVLSLLVFAARRWCRAALACGIGFAAGLGPYLCWSRLRYGGFLTTFRNGWGNFKGPEEPLLYYVSNFGNIFCWITLAGLALWIVRWLWEYRKRRSGTSEYRLTGSERFEGSSSRGFDLFLWGWAAAVLLVFSGFHHKEPRYIMPLAPPLFLLAGSGLSVLLRGRRAVMKIAGAAVLVGALAYSFHPVLSIFESPFINNELDEEMQVSDFLNHNLSPGTVLYTNFNYPVFAYYTNFPVHRLSDEVPDIYDDLNNLPEEGVLIAYKEDNIQDPRLEWLDANPHFQRLREFPSLVLYRYHDSVDGQKLP